MGWILRTANDLNNPTLPGGVYGKFITAGRGVYWNFDGTQTRGILFLCDGGKYGIDRLIGFEYKGAQLLEDTEWILHRGTLTAQIAPKAISSINTGTDVITMVAGHGLVNGDIVRAGVSDGNMPTPLSRTLKYQVSDVSGNDLKLKNEAGSSYIDITEAGTGTRLLWKANAGFDDPEQGLPTFVPEVDTTFNNIAYVEFKLPANRSSITDPPDWQDFRAIGVGRRLMEYNAYGVELGVIDGDDVALCNVARQIPDNLINNYKVPASRIDWASLEQMRQAGDAFIWQEVARVAAAEALSLPVIDDPPDEPDPLPLPDPDPLPDPEPPPPDDPPPPPDPPAVPDGWLARWFDDTAFTILYRTETVALIDYPVSSNDPFTGFSRSTFSVRFTGKVVPKYTELYTFTLLHNDDGKLYVNGQLLINKVLADGDTHTATFSMVANTAYDVQVDLVQSDILVSQWGVQLSWSSASQVLELTPTGVVTGDPGDPGDPGGNVAEAVRRYENHAGFPLPLEASEVHERMMERVPGWDWTDDNGLITFLPPDRSVVFAFAFDRIDDDSQSSFVKQSLSKKRRPLTDRPNFLLFRYRNVEETGFPIAFVQADRPALRDLTNGEPTNLQANDLGVATRSLAKRIGEQEMVLKSDPRFTINLSGARSSSKIRKCEFVTVSYYDEDGNYVVNQKCMVIFHAWGATNGKNDFVLLPIPTPYYFDEPYEATDTLINVALASNGAVGTASSTISSFSGLVQSILTGIRYTHETSGGRQWGVNVGWNDNTNNSWPDTYEVDFGVSRTISEIDVYTLSNNYQTQTSNPSPTEPATTYGIKDFTVEYWNGSTWVNIATVTNNTLQWRQFTFADITTQKIRVSITASNSNDYSRLINIEAWGS